MEEIQLTNIALIALATLGCGLIFERLKQPAALGYILGGIIISYLEANFDNINIDKENIRYLAELGIIMLLFLVGMELNLRSFKNIWHTSVGITISQIIISSATLIAIGKIFHLSFGLSITLAFSIALSSTAVAIKMLESIGELRTETGRLSIGVLIAQDLVIVPIILFIRNFGEKETIGWTVLFKLLLTVGILISLVLFLSRREKIKLPFARFYSGHEELQPLAAMLFCFGMATLSGLLELSAAYGAFLGGLIIGNSSERQSMIHTAKPIQSVLMMIFFLSVGLLLDFTFIKQNLWTISFLLIFITLGKTVFNIFIMHLFKITWHKAFLSGLILSQMGEFAFLLSSIGYSAGVIDRSGEQLIVTLAALSLVISPIWLLAARKLHNTDTSNIDSANQLINEVYKTEVNTVNSMIEKIKQIKYFSNSTKKTQKLTNNLLQRKTDD